MTVNGLTVFVVDDDVEIGEALSALLLAEGFAVSAFTCGEDFLEAYRPEQRGCLILDINLPRISGLDLQQILAERGIDLPVIFLTGFGDVPKATAGLKSGAIDFLEKPVEPDVLIRSVQQAIAIDAQRDQNRLKQEELEELYGRLTPREKEIIVYLSRGYSAKQIGRALGISHRTAEIHRARIMEKLAVHSLADLVALAIQIGVR